MPGLVRVVLNLLATVLGGLPPCRGHWLDHCLIHVSGIHVAYLMIYLMIIISCRSPQILSNFMQGLPTLKTLSLVVPSRVAHSRLAVPGHRTIQIVPSPSQNLTGPQLLVAAQCVPSAAEPARKSRSPNPERVKHTPGDLVRPFRLMSIGRLRVALSPLPGFRVRQRVLLFIKRCSFRGPLLAQILPHHAH